MNIYVLVKASLDVNMVRGDTEGNLLKDAIPLAISEYDRNAVYEAARIRNEHGGKVLVISVLSWGPIGKRMGEFENVVREALALGGDEAHVIIDEHLIEAGPSATAISIATLIKKLGKPDLILTGEASMDMMSSQVATGVASYLGINLVTFVRELSIKDGKAICKRDLEEYLEVLDIELPVVISVTGEINKPKLPTLLQIRRAFTKPLKKYDLTDLGLTNLKAYRPAKYELIRVSRKNIIIEGDSLEDIAKKLVNIFIEEGILRR